MSVASLRSYRVCDLRLALHPRGSNLLLATPVVLWCGLAILPALLDVAGQPQPEHVHADRPGHRRCLHLQRGGDHRARRFSPRRLRGMGGYPDVYFEAAAAITTLVLLGQVMELRARSRTSAAIRALLDLSPKTARLVTGDGETGSWRVTERKRHSARTRKARRPSARASRRKSSRRWRRARRPQLGRRVHDHRRIHSRRKIAGQRE